MRGSASCPMLARSSTTALEQKVILLRGSLPLPDLVARKVDSFSVNSISTWCHAWEATDIMTAPGPLSGCRCELFIAAAHRSRNQDGRPERPRWLRADLRFPVVPVKGAWQRDEPQGRAVFSRGQQKPFPWWREVTAECEVAPKPPGSESLVC